MEERTLRLLAMQTALLEGQNRTPKALEERADKIFEIMVAYTKKGLDKPVDAFLLMREAPKGFFEGETVFVVGGGPSLTGFAWRRLDGRKVLAINRALEPLPDATMLWWSDAKFYRWHTAAIAAHRAPLKATCQVGYEPGELLEDIAVFHASGLDGYDDRPGFLRHGNNSTYAAMHVAAGLGARKLVLLGVDMKYGPGGRTHWHTGHNRVTAEGVLRDQMLPQFRSLVAPLDRMGVEVLNANPKSALTLWPRITWDEALR